MTKQKLLQNCGWLGIVAVTFYFAHVIVGNILYEGYDPITQAVSDLTATGQTSKLAAGILTNIYGFFVTTFSIAFYMYFRNKINRVFSIGAILFIAMNVSSLGYAVFPLSDAGAMGTSFQDIMHLVVTVFVVLFGIAFLVLFAIGFLRKKHKVMGYLAIGTLVLMMMGSIMTGAIPAIFGLAERISIYSLHIYIAILAIFMLRVD